MKLIKLAQATPAGHVKIRMTIGKGSFEGRILEHGPNTGCGMEDDSALLSDLLEAEVGGYGDMGEITDGGHTQEYWQEKKQKQQATPEVEEEDSPFGISETPQDERKLDMGYGV